jgi:FO synthase
LITKEAIAAQVITGTSLPMVSIHVPAYFEPPEMLKQTLDAVARLVLDSVIPNIQASWVKMGPDGAALCLSVGANDMGGVLMDESITRAAGAAHGQELHAGEIDRIIRACGRQPRQRSTLYGSVSAERTHAAGQRGPAPVGFAEARAVGPIPG